MEVHQHHSHGKKNWKSYLSEFLMLFLAVFAGFIAENVRENFTEHERERQYIHSMIDDLTKDTLELRDVIKTNRKIVKKIDTLLTYLKMPASDSVTKKLYPYINYVSVHVLYKGSSATMTQLKNAGGFRLIRDTASVNLITGYDQQNESIRQQGAAYEKSCLDMLGFLTEILDFSSLKVQGTQPVFYMDRSPAVMRRFYNRCYIQQQLINVYCTFLDMQKKQAAEDIALLRKNYHL